MVECVKQEELEQCKYTVKTTVQVWDHEKNEAVNVTVNDTGMKLDYETALAMSYLQLDKFVKAGAITFLKVLGLSGDVKKAMEQMASE